ncbi:MAG: DUF262 domain-containing protein [Clostridia bacterium]|nr:DUF262 domain-containing protein [Clostridia bacterium]
MDSEVKITVDGNPFNEIDDSVIFANSEKDESAGAQKIRLVSIEEMERDGYSFFVPSYQRGYRWNGVEIRKLLDDIYEIYKVNECAQCRRCYCMHPLVIKHAEKVVDGNAGTIGSLLLGNKKLYDDLLSKNGKYNTFLKEKIKAFTDVENGAGISHENGGSPVYELVDGQQRLTSLYLILWACDLICDGGKGPKYSISYELKRNIDNTFIEDAVKIILDWFYESYEFSVRNIRGRQGSIENVSKFALTVRKDLRFIWYFSADEEDGKSLFRKINKGRIELTNAELFKAMLLNSSDDMPDRLRANTIAYEWDAMEQDLHNDDFWYFICNESYDSKTRIDYILDVYAGCLVSGRGELAEGLDEDKERYSFHVVSRHLDELRKKGAAFPELEVWEDIKRVHDKFHTWYDDIELYHNIGFLVAARGKTAVEFIRDLYNKCWNEKLSVTERHVQGLIHETFSRDKSLMSLDDFNYEDSKDDVRRLLLYSSIYPYIRENAGNRKKGGLRFPFRLYYGAGVEKKALRWNIEHISPQTRPTTADVIEDFADAFFSGTKEGTEYAPRMDEKSYLSIVRDFAKHVYKNAGKETDADVALEKFKASFEKINRECESGAVPDAGEIKNNLLKAFRELFPRDLGDMSEMPASPEEITGEDVHGIGNLVLLDERTNKGFKNAPYVIKRMKVIENDKNSVFVLPMTRKAFLNYFSTYTGEYFLWKKTDAEGYRRELASILEDVGKTGEENGD